MVFEVNKDGEREMKTHFLGKRKMIYFIDPDISPIQNGKYCKAYLESRLVKNKENCYSKVALKISTVLLLPGIMQFYKLIHLS